MKSLPKPKISSSNTLRDALLLASVLLSGICAYAEVIPAHILQAGMVVVVEYSKPLTLWGTADANEKFDIKVNNARKARVQADSEGKCKV